MRVARCRSSEPRRTWVGTGKRAGECLRGFVPMGAGGQRGTGTEEAMERAVSSLAESACRISILEWGAKLGQTIVEFQPFQQQTGCSFDEACSGWFESSSWLSFNGSFDPCRGGSADQLGDDSAAPKGSRWWAAAMDAWWAVVQGSADPDDVSPGGPLLMAGC